MKHRKYISAKSRMILLIILFFIPWTINAQVVIQRCDTKTGWEGAFPFSLDNSDKQEGKFSLKIEAQEGNLPWFSKSFSQTQTGITSSGYLSFWLYVSDASKLQGGQIEISSSGEPDNREYNWPLDQTMLTTGWNELNLRISDAEQSGGGASLDSINYFRIYQDLSAPITVKLDFVRFTPSTDSPSWPILDVSEVDNSSLDGKVMFGYQGWFNHPDDGADLGWIHWGNFYEPVSSTVDMYPDMREYGLDEKYNTDLTFPDGRMAPVFSSHNKNTVVRHMKWVRDYNLDGVFLQRFISAADDRNKMNNKDTVTSHIIDGCEKYGRVFSIMYDGIGNRVEDIKTDWMHLVDDIKVTESNRYLNHRNKPLVALWGYTVRDEATLDQLEEMIEFFKNNPEEKYQASLLLGVAWNWYDQSSGWMDAFREVEVISPWFSGNTDYEKGQYWCDRNNVDFLPVVHPGFSWHNLKGDQKNASPREGGDFLWDEVNHVVSKSAKSVYIAMFDEVDEGTAMFKLAENRSMIPEQGYWLPLNEDGYTLPSDWYLRAAGLVTAVVKGYEDNHTDFITPPEGIMTIRIKDEVNNNAQGGMEFIFPDFPDQTNLEISLDGGNSYPYTTADNAGSFTIPDLTEGTYKVFVRHNSGSPAIDMGDVYIGNAVELPPTQVSVPYPADQETGVRTELTLGWKAGEYAQSHVIYFGTTTSPDSVASQAAATYQPGTLEPNTSYYWKIKEVNAFGTTEGPLWSFTTGGAENNEGMIILDYCDSNTGWSSHSSITNDSEEKKEGFASLKSSGSGTVWFSKQFEKPVKTYCDTSSYLDLWLFVSDVTKFDGGGQIEITSSGGPDVDEYNWLIGDLNLVDGWNELHLKIGDASVMGNPDLAAINYMRIYQFLSGSIETRLDYVRFTGLVATPLGVPENFSATGENGSIFLDWDDNTDEFLAGYNLYRTNIPGITYSKLNTDPITESEYRDTDVINGRYYYYILSAVDSSGYESELTDMVSAKPADFSVPDAPVNLTAVPGDRFVQLDWDDNTETDLGGYNVYRTLTPGEGYGKVNLATVRESAYKDNYLVNGRTYYYVVKALDNSANESEASNEIMVTPGNNTSMAGLTTQGEIRVYPNPSVNKRVVLDPGSDPGKIQVVVRTLNGAVVYRNEISGGQNEISLESSPAGIYVISVQSEKRTAVLKLILQ